MRQLARLYLAATAVLGLLLLGLGEHAHSPALEPLRSPHCWGVVEDQAVDFCRPSAVTLHWGPAPCPPDLQWEVPVFGYCPARPRPAQ